MEDYPYFPWLYMHLPGWPGSQALFHGVSSPRIHRLTQAQGLQLVSDLPGSRLSVPALLAAYGSAFPGVAPPGCSWSVTLTELQTASAFLTGELPMFLDAPGVAALVHTTRARLVGSSPVLTTPGLLPALIQAGWCSPSRGRRARHRPFHALPVFAVPKAHPGKHRLITDCRVLNMVLPRPPPLQLPRLPVLLHSIHDAVVHCPGLTFYTHDLTGWFYQLPVSGPLRDLLVIRCPGHPPCTLNLLPMGLSWSPYIGQLFHCACLQLALNALPAPGAAYATSWIDNALILATPEMLLLFRSSFHHWCDSLPLAVKEASIASSLSYCGLDLEIQRAPERFMWRVLPSVRQRLLESPVLESLLSPRALFGVAGRILWVATVGLLPLCWIPEVLLLMRHVGSAVLSKSAWLVPEPTPQIWQRVLHCFPFYLALANQSFCLRASDSVSPPSRCPTWRLWSDASDWGWGIVLSRDSDTLTFSGPWDERQASWRVFLREAAALLVYGKLILQHLLGPCPARALEFFSDNAALVAVLRRGYSSHYIVNFWLQPFFPPPALPTISQWHLPAWSCHWLPTDTNPADGPSRGSAALPLSALSSLPLVMGEGGGAV